MSIENLDEFVADVRADLDHFYPDLWKDYVSAEPTHLFHYTSSEALIGIVSNRTFFLTDVSASTDQSEIRHGIDVVREVLEEYAVECESWRTGSPWIRTRCSPGASAWQRKQGGDQTKRFAG
jgi:hypothetical protein